MRRLGYDAELKQFPQAWRVNFRVRGDEDVVGSASEETLVAEHLPRAASAALNLPTGDG